MLPEDSAQLITTAAAAAPNPSIVEAIQARTEGNPFFTTEIVRHLAESDELLREVVARPGSVRIPEGVREAIGRRLNRLSDECNTSLTTASVIGREFDLRVLGAVGGDPSTRPVLSLSKGPGQAISEIELLDLVDEALNARVIEEVVGSPDRYQFSHALVQETLADELSAARRVRLHARIAEAFEESYAEDADSHATELAYHFGEAAPVLGPEKVVTYSTLAGEKALATYAYEAAVVHFQRVLDAREGQPIDDDIADLLLRLARVQVALSSFDEAVQSMERAFHYYAAGGDVARAIATVENPEDTNLAVAMRHLLEEALKLAPSDSRQAARLQLAYGLAIGASSEGYDRGKEVLDQALTVARRDGDVALEMLALANAAVLDSNHVRLQAGLDHALWALELADRCDEPAARWRAPCSGRRSPCTLWESRSGRRRTWLSY